MTIKDTITENLIQFILVFAVAFFFLFCGALYVNIEYELWTTELGQSYNYETIPLQIQYEIIAKYIILDLAIVGTISFIAGIFVAGLFSSDDF